MRHQLTFKWVNLLKNIDCRDAELHITLSLQVLPAALLCQEAVSVRKCERLCFTLGGELHVKQVLITVIIAGPDGHQFHVHLVILEGCLRLHQRLQVVQRRCQLLPQKLTSAKP